MTNQHFRHTDAPFALPRGRPLPNFHHVLDSNPHLAEVTAAMHFMRFVL